MQDVPDEYNQLSYRVIGASIEVHRVLGPGYLESVYEEALKSELTANGLKVESQFAFNVQYRGQTVGQGKLGLLVESMLIVELKIVEHVLPIHKAQLISYLKAMRLPLGLLINFNFPVLKDGVTRMVYHS